MHWTESKFWKTMALLAVFGIFCVAWSMGTHRDLPLVQPAPAEDILVLPAASLPRLQVMTTTNNGSTLIWWHFRKQSLDSIDLVETKSFQVR